MIIKYIERFLEGVQSLMDFVQKGSNKLSFFLSIILLQWMILGSFSSITAQETGIDANAVYGEENQAGQDETNAGPSAHTVRGTSNTSSALIATRYVLGVEVMTNVENPEEYSPMTRSGFLGTTDTAVTALLIDPPGVGIPQHLANQWLPGSSSGTATVYAQGEGYAFLKNDLGIEKIWEMFRNMAYAGFVLIIIAAGFMIMFRSKIGGQVTVGMMNTLPGIIIGLVLVTFSFAIVGFIMDLGRLLSLIIGAYMEKNLVADGFEVVSLSGPIQMARYAFSAAQSANLDSLKSMWDDANPLLRSVFIAGSMAGGWVIESVLGVLVILIVGLAALWAAIKVYMTLMMAYLKIVLDLVLGPLHILIGSLPGKSPSMVNWLKRIVSNVLVFPVVFFIINMVRFIGYDRGIDVSSPLEFMSGGTFTSSFLQIRGILVIAGYFLAAGAPGIIAEALAIDQSKGATMAVQDAKKSASKIPLIGGFVGG